ncbi:MAG: bifunctional precorrin-2 dehydrogenase/sirohydrochlorin ferrochelatase [Desulfamplus sp.]|nr:bifunctional precorrin-2 dehydrogenase/sirohydrochlorin ferrochelatase [Desulfamplus sp.]
MQYYPVNLNIAGKNCLVVGGGKVGARKAITLIKAGAMVTVISPAFSHIFFQEPLKSHTSRIERSYESTDMENVFLVFGATDNPRLNSTIAEDALSRGALCNIADNPDKSHFILPSIVQRGELLISVSTSGTSPALARMIRQKLEQDYGDEYALFLLIMGKIRKKLLGSGHAPDKHAVIFRQLVNSDLLEKIAVGDTLGMEHTLQSIFKQNIFNDQREPDTSWLTHDLKHIYDDLITNRTRSQLSIDNNNISNDLIKNTTPSWLTSDIHNIANDLIENITPSREDSQ